MRTKLIVLLMTALCCSVQGFGESVTNEAVILLHGMARSSKSMEKMAAALREVGYDVHALDYPSTDKSVEELSREHVAKLVAEVQASEPAKIHFVTHSLGAIVLRHYLGETRVDNLGRIVMLGPPNKGSEVVDTLGHMKMYQWINGPAGNQLGTDTDSLPNTLPVPDTDIGVIAGTRSINWILSTYIPGTDDGKVSPENAKIDGMKDFTTIKKSHPFLMKSPRAIELTINFLRYGYFEEE